MRLGPGPVFVYEWLTTARRWQPYAMRAAFVWLVLLGLAIVESDSPRRARSPLVSLHDLAVIGEQMYRTIAWIELTLVLLAAPAATAGAVCLDKARGTLDHMLATDLSNAEIVLGKLGVRLIPVLGLIACTVPILALASLLGGIDPMALVGLFAVAIGCALVGCSLAMVLSIYGRKTHEVVMMAYVLIISWVMAPLFLEILISAMTGPVPPPPPPGAAPVPTLPPAGPPRWLILTHEVFYQVNPYILALAPYDAPGQVGEMTYLGFLAGCLAVSTGMVVPAMARVRRVALRQAGRPVSGGHRRLSRILTRPWLPGPSLDGNPVAWREWHCTRPALMMRIAWGLYAALGLLGVGLAAWPSPNRTPGDELIVGIMTVIQVSIGLLLLSVGAATSLAEERVRGSLDVLLSTPMSTRSILAGKWWGGFRRILGVVIWPAATAAFLAYDSGYWIGYILLLGLVLAHGAVVTGLGLGMATWVGRPGRAIALCVTVFLLSVIGWPIVLRVSIWDETSFREALLTGALPVGVMYATMATSASGVGPITHGAIRGEVLLWVFGWIVVLAIVAATLFSAAAGTFDGCLGRIPGSGVPRPRPRGLSSLSPGELLAMVSSSAEDET
jgi:ABC-type transport system involved in multi-copper enzyme maturation permease subunit